MVDHKKTNSKSSELRRQHNLDLMRRMRGGESLNAYDSKASWFPPRPIVKKDEKEISRVYQNPSVPVLKPREPVHAKAQVPDESASNVVQFVSQEKRNRTFDEAG